ncbi:MAG: hypothetical protein CXX72_00230 [Methanobacteriota archaeon]|nr:MAG: hypothetical protein CXX72_00230 [Euryarchaeota archaeon]
MEQWRANSLDISELDADERFPVAEHAAAEQEEALVSALAPVLSEAELQFVNFRRAQATNDATAATEAIRACVADCRRGGKRDHRLEARARMEQGLIRFSQGEEEEAGVDLRWAMERLKVLDEGSAAHGVALLNMAAWHETRAEWMMGLAMHSEISRHGPHLEETVALSRLAASRLQMHLRDHESALRHSWVAVHGLSDAGLSGLAVEAALIWLNLALTEVDGDAPRMQTRVEESFPRKVGQQFVLNSHPEDVAFAYDVVLDSWDGAGAGTDRVDLKLMLQASRVLGMVDFEERLRLAVDISDEELLQMLESPVDQPGSS